jgi:Zn-dependent peptidase ImmA (M78 family)
MSHSVPLVRPRSAKEIDDLAFDLIRAFQPDAIKMITKFDVERFFDCELEGQTGIEPVYESLGDKLDGYTDSAEMKCIICRELAEYGEDDVQRRRLRATIAHEIGHCYLHVEDSRRARTTLKFLQNSLSSLEMYRQEDLKAYENPEWQAWRFAGALLMPECCIRAAVHNGWTKKQMQWAFDVNPSFLDVRLRDLKIGKTIRRG